MDFATGVVSPAPAYYNPALNGLYLHYDDVRGTPEPEQALLEFCRTTYAVAAEKGSWDRASLERAIT